jgi:enoyl-[acyl-carrier protein] reductase I
MAQASGLMQGKRGAVLGVANNRSIACGAAGPSKTLAASGIGDFRCSALHLLSDLSRGVTAEVSHVHSGHHVVGMKRPKAPDTSLAKE